jgi:hypothetical protein
VREGREEQQFIRNKKDLSRQVSTSTGKLSKFVFLIYRSCWIVTMLTSHSSPVLVSKKIQNIIYIIRGSRGFRGVFEVTNI